MFLDILGHRVNTVSFGHGPRTIVGAGGWIGDWELWQQPFEILSQRYRVITYDHVGAGETTVPLDVLTFESLVEMVFGVIDAYEVKRCVLAGESYGATVAIMAALQQPDRFESLVLVDGAPGGFDHSGTRRFVSALRSDFDRTIARFVDWITPEPDVEHIRRWLRHILHRSEPEAAARLVECMFNVDLTDRLVELALPTLIVHGELDPIAHSTVAVAEAMARSIPGSRLAVISGAGHVPTLTRPREVAEAIEGFFGA